MNKNSIRTASARRLKTVDCVINCGSYDWLDSVSLLDVVVLKNAVGVLIFFILRL